MREIGRRIKGPLWGTDCIVLEGEGTADVLKKWAERIEESISEAKLVDAYKMQEYRHSRARSAPRSGAHAQRVARQC